MNHASPSARCYDFVVCPASSRPWMTSAIFFATFLAILMAMARPAAAAPTRKVAIDTEPHGASVYVGDKDAGAAGVTPIVLDLPVGENVLIIELANFTPRFETITVPKAKGKVTKVTYQLERGAGTIVVQADSAAKGARVVVDDEDKGTAPARIEVSAGKHQVVVSNAKGKIFLDELFDVEAGAEATVSARAPRPLGPRERDDEKPPRRPPPREAEVRERRDSEDAPDHGSERSDADRGAAPKVATGDDLNNQVDHAGFDDRGDHGSDAGEEHPREAFAQVRVSPLFELGYRYFNYRQIQSTNNTPALRDLGNLLFGLRLEVMPLRQLPSLMVSGVGGYSLKQRLQSSQGAVNAVWWRAGLAASYRLAFGSRFGVLAVLGFDKVRYEFSGPAAAFALVPDASYTYLRLGAGLTARFKMLEATALLENRPVLSGGLFADRFRTSSADGLAAQLSAVAHLNERYFGRVDASYARYAWSFGFDETGAYRAGGALDRALGISLSAGAAF
jgi:PEGA domain